MCKPKAARLSVSAWQKPEFLLCPHALGSGWGPGAIQSAETSCLVPWGPLGVGGAPRTSGDPGACWEDCLLTLMLARLVPQVLQWRLVTLSCSQSPQAAWQSPLSGVP